MASRIIADVIMLLHFLFILYVIFGAALALLRRWLIWPHLTAAIWAVVVNHTGWGCPLTPLEIHFRKVAGQQGYSGGFIDHYIMPVVYPSGLTEEIAIYLSIAIVSWNAACYWYLLHMRRRKR